jgi:hypothetical protein
MSKRSTPGSNVVSRLAERHQGGLYRRELPGGGEVYTGPTATRALRSIGARAFTMDNTIFVAEDFDASSTDDQALYAHERHHQLNSGGDGAAASYHDAEELAARAIERMVLHRAEQGEDFGSIMRDVNANRATRAGDIAAQRSAAPGAQSRGSASSGGGSNASQSASEDAAAAAYSALLAQGRDHLSIVNELANHVVESLGGQASSNNMHGGSTGVV